MQASMRVSTPDTVTSPARAARYRWSARLVAPIASAPGLMVFLSPRYRTQVAPVYSSGRKPGRAHTLGVNPSWLRHGLDAGRTLTEAARHHAEEITAMKITKVEPLLLDRFLYVRIS